MAGIKKISVFRLYRQFCLLACLLMPALWTVAQQGTNDQMVILKEFEGKVKEADKISLAPDIPDIKDAPVKFNYKVPEREFKQVAFEPNPLKPLGMAADKLERYNGSYIKLGFGSQLTPLAELMFNDNKVKNMVYGFYYDHLSQYGFHIRNQKYSDDKAGAYMKYFMGKMQLAAEFGFHNLRTHFYGSPDTSYDGSAILQNLRNYDLKISLKNTRKNKTGIDYYAAVRGNYMQETYGKGYEYFVNGNAGANYNFLKFHSVFADFRFDVSDYHNAQQDQTRTLFFTKLGYGFNNDDWKAHAAATVAADNSSVYILPDLYLEKRLYEHKLIAYAGWEMRLDKNSFESLSALNNFVNSVISLKNTRVSDVYGGLKGTMEGFSYNIRVAYKDIDNMPLFYTNYFDVKRFYVSYDPQVNDLNAMIEFGYNFKETFRLWWTTEINSYQLTDNQYAWYNPLLKSSLKASYVLQKKIVIGAGIYTFSDYYGFLSPGNIRTTHATADASLSIEYLYNKHFSFFGNLNNIAHQRYEIWANYPVYGINGLVGAKFSF